MARNYCYPLSRVGSAIEFGRKASNLARVSRIGYCVPETMAINRDALGLFISTNILQESIEAYIKNVTYTRSQTSFEELVATVNRAVVPKVLQDEIYKIADKLQR